MILLYLVGLSVTALGLLTICAIWYITRNPTMLRSLPIRHRTKLQAHLYDTAHGHEYNERWTKAQRAYHLLTILQPANPRIWRRKAIAHLEGQDPRGALRTLREAQRALALPDPRVLELEVLTHQDLDDPQQARNTLRRLAELDPHQAQDFIFDLELHDLADDPDIQQALGPNPGGGGIDGYA